MKGYRLLFIFVLFILPGCTPLTPRPQPLTAVIAEIEGDEVLVLHPQDRAASPATLNETIEVYAKISTGNESRVRLDLSNGTIIRIGPHSSFTLEENYETENGLFSTLRMEFGQIWIVLKGGELNVETPSGLAGVRGSYMSGGYDASNGALQITCLEGNCSALNESGTIDFNDGEAVDLDADSPSPEKRAMTPAEYRMWAENVPETGDIMAISCTVSSSFLYARECPSTACAVSAVLQSGDQLALAFEEGQDNWLAVFIDGKAAWLNGKYCPKD